MTTKLVWVVGASGLLGSALARREDPDVLFRTGPVPWSCPSRAIDVLTDELRRFAARVRTDDEWEIYWAAGAGVIGSNPATFARESEIIAGFVERLGGRLPRGRGALFFASSGAVYAGSHSAPFSESTPPAPLSPYAIAKREQELVISAALAGRLPHVLGRISTLYGPGQDLDKTQGLVSRTCLQAARCRPVSVYVPVDTLRDYLYVDDAARMIGRFVERARAERDLATRVRVVADGRPSSILELAARVRAISHRRIGMHHMPIATSAQHVHDLRMRTEHGAEVAGIPRTPAPNGIHAVYSDIIRRLARGEFA